MENDLIKNIIAHLKNYQSVLTDYNQLKSLEPVSNCCDIERIIQFLKIEGEKNATT